MSNNKVVGLVQPQVMMVKHTQGVPPMDVPKVRGMLAQAGRYVVTVNSGHIVKVEPVGEDIADDLGEDAPEEEQTETQPTSTPTVRKTRRSHATAKNAT